VSRIHDALQRGRAPADLPNAGRPAHADAVLAALGYKSRKLTVTRGALKRLALVLVPLAAVAWFLLPSWRPTASRLEARGSRLGKPLASVAPLKLEPRAPKIEKPQNDPRPSIPEPRPPAVAAPASKIEIRNPTIAKPRNDPRPSTLDPRAPVPAPDEFQLALYYQRTGDFEQALLHYRTELQRDEMNVEAHNNLGHLYLGKRLFEEAAREFQRVIAIDPKYVAAHVNVSVAYLALGRPDAAAAEARTALQIDPRNPDAMVNLSLAQNAAGQAGDAQGSLRRALEIDPHNAAAHYNLARQFEAAGEASAAIDHYQQFIQYASPDQTAYAADVRARLAALAARLK
jgi:Tfp pilus assembly protein PilF